MNSKSSLKNTESHENPVTRLRKGAARHGRVAADGMAAGIGGRTPRTGTVSDQRSDRSRPERLGGRLQAGPAEIHPAKDGEIPERTLLPTDGIPQQKQQNRAVRGRLPVHRAVHRQPGQHASDTHHPGHPHHLQRNGQRDTDGLHVLPAQHIQATPATETVGRRHGQRNLGIYHPGGAARRNADDNRAQPFLELWPKHQQNLPPDQRPRHPQPLRRALCRHPHPVRRTGKDPEQNLHPLGHPGR